MSTLNVSQTDSLLEFIEEQVSGGDYKSASEFIRELVRHAREKSPGETMW